MPFTRETWSQSASPTVSTNGEAGQHHALTAPQPRSHPSISQKQKPIRKAKKPKDAPGSEASHSEQGRKGERQYAPCSGTGGKGGVGSQAGRHQPLAVPVGTKSRSRVRGSSVQGHCSQRQCGDGGAITQNAPAALQEGRDEGIRTQMWPHSCWETPSDAACVPPSSYIAVTDLPQIYRLPAA